MLEFTNSNASWFELDKERLETNNFNLACCFSFADKRLVFMDYFKYKWINSDPMLNSLEQSTLDSLQVSTSSSSSSSITRTLPSTESSTKSEQTSEQTSMATSPAVSVGGTNALISGELQVSKSLCWPFSRTIRVDIRPLCLCVNKTEHSVLLIEKNSRGEFDYDIEPRLGRFFEK